MILKFRDWEFEVDKELTRSTYAEVIGSGADTCVCNDCKKYVAYRAEVFPDEIQNLFNDLGINYRKEVEITHIETHSNGLHHIAGWFHFKGRLLKGENYRVSIPGTEGYTFELTKITDTFSIGFGEGSDLTYFEDKSGLVQVEFDTSIPWVIDKSLEATN